MTPLPTNIVLEVGCRTRILELNRTLPKGGFWVYNGYSSSSAAGPFTDTPSSGLFKPYVTGQILYGGEDNFDIYPSLTSAGYYSLTYNRLGSASNLIIEIVDGDDCVGQDQTISFSATNSTPQDLTAYLTDAGCPVAATGGTWTNIDSASGFSAPNFTPSTAGAGTYRFKYKFSEYDTFCIDCDTEITITVEVVAAYMISISSSDTSCTRTITVEHPSTTTTNSIQVVMDTGVDVDYPVFKYKYRITDSCGASDILSSEQTYAFPGIAYMGVFSDAPDPGIGAGGWVETVRLYSVTEGTIDVPLAPSGANQAVFSGSGGTTNATALTFNGTNQSTFTSALGIALNNYLLDTVGLSASDYDYRFFNMSGSNRPALYMGIYHSAPNDFVGIQRASAQIVYKHDGITTTTSSEIDEIVSSPSFTSVQYVDGNCITGGNALQIKGSFTLSSFYTAGTLDYDDFPLTASAATLSVNSGTSNQTESCAAKVLSTSNINCAGSVTYLWSSGETSSSVTKDVGTGSYTVTGTCSSPASSDDDTISI